MAAFITFLLSFWAFLPWVAIALMAYFAYHKSPQSRMLLFQLIGAGAAFLLGIMRWVLFAILGLFSSNVPGLNGAINSIFDFLLFLSLTTFAIGYCLERFRRRGPETVQVSARPVD